MAIVDPPLGPAAVETAELERARALVRNTLGSALADKASDAFCLALARPVPQLEGIIAIPPTPAAAVLEFAPWSPDELGHAGELTDELSARFSEVISGPGDAAAAARHLAIRKMRDKFSADAAPIRSELEVKAALAVSSRRLVSSAVPPGQTTDLCWLNRTMRAETDPRLLADVAAHPGIDVIDLPRLIAADAGATGPSPWPSYLIEHEVGERGGEGIIVAVIDGEVAVQHAAFEGRAIQKHNFTDEPWGLPIAHATAVAGIVGAHDIGIARGTTIYNYKVIGSSGPLNSDDFEGAVAIQHALEDGALVANCSWGVGAARDGRSREVLACETAWAYGLTIVKSAGNKGPAANTLTTPAEAEGVIVVGATDRLGTKVEDYSSRGPTSGGRSRPHLVAPGGSPGDPVTATLLAGGSGPAAWGTSCAAPVISGIAACLLAEARQRPSDLRATLQGRCVPLPGFSDNDQGAGLIH